MKILENTELEKYIQKRLVSGWTPEERTGRLKLENNERAVISFKSIYKELNTAQGSRYVKELPYAQKRIINGRSRRMKKNIGNRIFVDKRPDIVNKRLRVGDFEGDILGVPKYTRETIARLVDRRARFFLGRKIPRPKYASYAFKELGAGLVVHSYTLDNGVENIGEQELGCTTYFCHAYHSWEKGTIENTFLRLRRYIPKKARLSDYSDEERAASIDKMNNTSRKYLGYLTPKEVFSQQQLKFQQKSSQFTSLKCCTSGKMYVQITTYIIHPEIIFVKSFALLKTF